MNRLVYPTMYGLANVEAPTNGCAAMDVLLARSVVTTTGSYGYGEKPTMSDIDEARAATRATREAAIQQSKQPYALQRGCSLGSPQQRYSKACMIVEKTPLGWLYIKQ